MIIDEKPSLDEVYLEHWGVRGMKWGVRKKRDREESKAVAKAANPGGIVITQAQKRKAVAIAGAVAVGSALYATGNLKAATMGGTKFAVRGAMASTRIIAKVGIYSVKTIAQTASVVLGTTAKGVGDIAAKTAETVGNGGRAPVPKVSALTRGKESVASLSSKLKFKPRTPKPALKLYPTESIFSGRASKKVTEIDEVQSRFASLAERVLRRNDR